MQKTRGSKAHTINLRARHKKGDSSKLGTAAPKHLTTGKMAPVRHLSVTQQTMEPTKDIHRDEW